MESMERYSMVMGSCRRWSGGHTNPSQLLAWVNQIIMLANTTSETDLWQLAACPAGHPRRQHCGSCSWTDEAHRVQSPKIMKVSMALEHGTIPSTIGIENLNPNLRLEEWNISIVTDARPWPGGSG